MKAVTVPVFLLPHFIMFCSENNLLVRPYKTDKCYLFENSTEEIPVIPISLELYNIGKLSFLYHPEMEVFIKEHSLEFQEPIECSFFDEFLLLLKRQKSPLSSYVEIFPDYKEQL